MKRSIGNIIADSLHLSLGYADRLLTDVSAERFARFSTPGGETVHSNHPAFIYGHLALYAPRILTELQQPAPAVPEGFNDCFSKDAQCQDDGEGVLYPAMEDVLNCFRTGYQAAAEALKAAPDEAFEQENPNEGRLRELFPTIGSMHAFYCGGHMMIHMGQMSAWRRMEGLGAA